MLSTLATVCLSTYCIATCDLALVFALVVLIAQLLTIVAYSAIPEGDTRIGALRTHSYGVRCVPGGGGVGLRRFRLAGPPVYGPNAHE